jgi:hypothetical protein
MELLGGKDTKNCSTIFNLTHCRNISFRFMGNLFTNFGLNSKNIMNGLKYSIFVMKDLKLLQNKIRVSTAIGYQAKNRMVN